MTLSSIEQDLTLYAVASPMRDHVETWSSINSGTNNVAGVNRVGQLIADTLGELPGTLRFVAPEPEQAILPDGSKHDIARGHHLLLSVRPKADRRILLTGHMDTVFGTDHPFQTVRTLEPGILNGPGVADMKGGIAVMIAALTAFETAECASALGYDVLLNSDEETGSKTSAALITELAHGKIAALTYEPAALPDGTLAGARPGSGNFSFIISGKSAHAGRNPDDGRNAILAAADLTLALAALRSPDLSVNPAKIDGGGPNNVVPDHAILRVNLRPMTPEIEHSTKAAIGMIVSNVAARHDVTIHSHGGFGRPPKPMTAGAERLYNLVRACGHDLGQDIHWKTSGGVCDGNNIAACGVPVIDTMGVCGGAIHSSDEYLILASLADRAALSALTLYRIAQGAF